ncbi:unnamed protein product [Spirodela intermedia]|uniref:Uncharacterized protein n=1 Tax=Spirodela intermedia TaxID=51605 RepID=A0A7I8LK64_SPIIN|nr:unnamed protein product [Spirodela intermedia]
MGHRVIFGGCHLAEQKNGDFEVATRLLVDRPLPNDGFNFSSNVSRIVLFIMS